MNAENVDMEKMRKAWLEMGKALGMQPSSSDNNPKNLNNMRTTLDRLRDKYRMFRTVALLMVFGSFMIFSRGWIIESRLSFRLGVAYAVYFLTCFVMDQWLYYGIGTIDPLRMSVSDVVEKSLFYKKRHLQFMVALIPMAVCLLGFTGYVFSAEKYMLAGMVAGAICGAAMGIVQFRRFMADYRKLSE